MKDSKLWAAGLVLLAAFTGFLGGRFSLLCQGPLTAITGDAALEQLPPVALESYLVEENDQTEETLLVDINRADEQQLQLLPGIGPARAQKIIAYRQSNGPFESKEEMLAVEGIGDQIFMNLRDHVTIGTVD